MWYKSSDIKKLPIIELDNLHGYILPHAGTKHTGQILSHTLRFKPKNNFTDIYILYYPSNNEENIIKGNKKYYHEYYVLWKTLSYICEKHWRLRDINIQGFNIKNNEIPNKNPNALMVLSVDFSHNLAMNKAIKLENCAAAALMNKQLENLSCLKVVDHIDTIKTFYDIMPEKTLQWVGRTRSNTLRGVGYLSFLIRDFSDDVKKDSKGMFVTAYDVNMTKKECLGKWFERWSSKIENDLINKVISSAKKTSRLTGGKDLNIPLCCYSITYLYPEKTKRFIRGWHGIRKDAFYLSDVFLENTFNNGRWISPNDTIWPRENKFNLNQTFKKLNIKSNKTRKITNKNYKLYSSSVLYKELSLAK